MSMEKRMERWKIADQEMSALLQRYNIDTPMCGAAVGLGWIPIVDRLFEQMSRLGSIPKVTQIKSKFCQLRVYFDQRLSSTHEELLLQACAECDLACEQCGVSHGLHVPRCGRALCQGCQEGEEN